MNNYTKIISNMEEKIKNFSKKISEGIDKKKKRDFVFEMLYGLIASNSCLLSEIARSLMLITTLKYIKSYQFYQDKKTIREKIVKIN